MAYGMKDAANLIAVDLATGVPALFIDYANATSSEWSAESVFAMKKGTNAIRWDNARTGTLTLDTELFDFGLLAMVMGSNIKDGIENIFTRNEGTLSADRIIALKSEGDIDLSTVSVVKLRGKTNEHEGLPLINATAATAQFPGQVKNITVSVNDKNAKITFDRAEKADSYVVFRDGEVIGNSNTNEFQETGLTPETDYVYSVASVNGYGEGAKSAVVEVTTAAEGSTAFTPVVPTQDALTAAESNTPNISGIAEQATFTIVDKTVVLSEATKIGDRYAIYFMEEIDNVRTLTIGADTFPGNYEIFADARIREENGADELVQIHYFNAKPQSNFTLTQSSTEPTSLSIVFDLFPVKGILAEMKVIQ